MSTKKDDLEKIVGVGNVFDDPETLDAYSKDHSFARPMKPWFVVKPKNADEVQEVVRWANKTATPLVPISSGGVVRFRGDTVPSVPGAVIVDLSQMNRIIRVDRRNRMTIIEPGVTYGQLQPELAKEGMRVSTPLLPRSNKSVIASFLEREPIMIPRYQWVLTDPLRCVEVIWGNSDRFLTGEVGHYKGTLEAQWKIGLVQVSPKGPAQTDFYRFVSGAQGSMGIVTWASLKCEVLPRVHKLLFVPSERLDNLLGFAYRLLRFRLGDELLLLNSSNLAFILGDGTDQINKLKKEIPPWVLILGLAGRDWLPQERVEFQEKGMLQIAQQFGVWPVPVIPGARDRQIMQVLSTPSREPYWKLRYKGGCQDIFFLTTLNRTPEFVENMYSVAEKWGYSGSDIGVYIQPVQQGASCHCEFNLPYNPGNQIELTRVRELFTQASEALLNKGAFYSRPYGIWADMAYSRDTPTTIVLKKIKGIFDTNNVMNPGKLCY